MRFSSLLFTFILALTACGSDSLSNIYDSPLLVAVDSTNDRLFVVEKQGELFALTASTQAKIGKQPMVSEKRQETLHDLLPSAPLDMGVFPNGASSRVFISGAQSTDDGTVLNQILVIDFDGATPSIASFSPITVADNDGTTDESDNLPGGLLVDAATGRLYVTDATGGALFIFNTSDGTAVRDPLAIAGTPNRMSLAGSRLYVANSTATEVDQVVTVVNTNDFTTTQIDLEIPTSDIAVLTNNSGTVLLAKSATTQAVLVTTVDTTTFAAATSIAVADNSAVNGALSAGTGLTSAVGRLLVVKDASDTVYGYVPQADGNVSLVTLVPQLSSFTVSSIKTISRALYSADALKNGDGIASTVFITATSTGEVLVTNVGSNTVTLKF